ncbi:MAG: TIGR04211 family SH3 domain-containing protein [Deltaproteobacteria bacterium]|nr:TIGR04211 family SH3 domain-containing protein [Deltaproteobacteria bacterium]
MIKGLLTAAVLFMLPAFAGAETMYITDRIEASVRSGKGLAAGSKYLGVVRTGDAVEVLAMDGDYAQVRLGNGMEGWLHMRYLIAAPPADSEKLKEKNKSAQDEVARLREEKAGLEALRNQQALKMKEDEAAFESLKAGCADYIKARAEIEKAQQEVALQKEITAQLTKENELLAQNTRLMWFIFGAAAVLCGFIIGMWLQSLRKRRKPRISF